MICLDDVVKELIVEKVPDIKENCNDCISSKCGLNFQYSSTDALYVLFPNNSTELYFIEFKKKDVNNPATLTPYIEQFLSDLIENINEIAADMLLLNKICWHLGTEIDIRDMIKMLNKARKESQNAQKYLLKLKPLESLHCILQWVYRLYCFEKSITPNLNAFESFLLGCKKEYVIVYEEKGFNRTKARLKELRSHHSCENNPYECHRLSPYPFDYVRTRNQEQFLNFITCINDPDNC